MGGMQGRVSWRAIGWGGAAVLLSIPLIAGFPWTLSDFVVMGVMLGVAGLAVELAARVSGSGAYRLGALVAVVACFLLVWINLAVGIFGNEDNPANLLFLGVILIAAGGALAFRRDPRAVACVMLIAAGAQLAVSSAGYGLGLGAGGSRGLGEAVMSAAVFVPLWLIAAGLFARAARQVSGTAAR